MFGRFHCSRRTSSSRFKPNHTRATPHNMTSKPTAQQATQEHLTLPLTPVPIQSPLPTPTSLHDQISKHYFDDRLFDAYDLLIISGPKIDPKFSPHEHPLYSDIVSTMEFSYPLLKILKEPPQSHFHNLCYDKDGIQVRYYDGSGKSKLKDDDESVPSVVRSFLTDENNRQAQSLWVKGRINCSDVLTMISILYEVDLYHHWVPGLKEGGAHLIKEMSSFHVFCEFHWNLTWPMSDRKLWTEGIGISRIKKHGEILVAIRSFEPDSNDELKSMTSDFMKRVYPKGDKSVELSCPFAAFLLRAVSKDEVELTIVSTVNPQVQFVPAWLRDMATKSASPDVIRKIREIVQKVETDEKYKEYMRRMTDTKKQTYDEIRERLSAYWAEKENGKAERTDKSQEESAEH